MITNLLRNSFDKFGKDIGLEDKYLPRINMKNEFLLDKQLTTNKKKTYASSIIQQEGHLIQPAEIDIKGMAIRKVNTNKKIRDEFTKILTEEILTKKGKINPIKIIERFSLVEEEITSSLHKGETEYLIPSKANNAEAYDNPLSINAFKAATAWNLMFPEKELQLPAKFLMLKVDIPNFDVIKEKIKDEESLNRFRELFKVPEIAGKGLNSIAIDTNKIPDCIRPFISYDKMVETHIKPGMDILESVGIKTIETSNSAFNTNFVKL